MAMKDATLRERAIMVCRLLLKRFLRIPDIRWLMVQVGRVIITGISAITGIGESLGTEGSVNLREITV
ncbi:hypothetical protein D3C86_2114110 [compost metagenome]